jgi:hypothetical protein
MYRCGNAGLLDVCCLLATNLAASLYSLQTSRQPCHVHAYVYATLVRQCVNVTYSGVCAYRYVCVFVYDVFWLVESLAWWFYPRVGT